MGAGSSDLMGLIADAYLGVGTEALVSDICFPVYANVTRTRRRRRGDRAAGGRLPLRPGAHARRRHQPHARGLPGHTEQSRPASRFQVRGSRRVSWTSSPQNVLCVLDLAYHDYIPPAGAPHPLRLLRKHPNVVLLRTFSKVYGLAGLRVGYAVASRDVTAALDRVRIPFTTSTPAQVAGRVALHDDEHRNDVGPAERSDADPTAERRRRRSGCAPGPRARTSSSSTPASIPRSCSRECCAAASWYGRCTIRG